MSTNHENTPAKHTPGPWRFYTKPQPNGCPIVGSGGLMVAIVAHSVNQPDQKDTALANAALIAAAPELLAACRKKLTAQMLRETALAHELYTARDSAMQAAEEAEFEADEFMHAAIAKAEGRTA